MGKSIKDVFDDECKLIKFDIKLIRKIGSLEVEFVNKNEDNITFFGGTLIGTPPMRFLSVDRNAWFDTILEVDDMVLRGDLHSLPTIFPERKVSSDEFNLSTVWLLHAIERSKNLSASQKHQGKMAALKYLHYKFLGSLMAHNFEYEPDRAIAEATYAALNYKFALKVHGSWAALIESRCEDIVSKNSIHRRTIEKFDNDGDITYMVTDIQGRIREIVKKIVRVFYEVHKSGKWITSRTNMVDVDGELQVRDLIRNNSTYKRYAHNTMVDRSTFIRDELVGVVLNAIPTMPEKHFITTLEYFVDNYGHRGDKKISLLIDETMLHTFGFLQDNKDLVRNGTNLANILTRLRSLYMSSRTSDPALLKMRKLSLSITKRTIKTSNKALLASVRTGAILYIVLRTLTMKYYTS